MSASLPIDLVQHLFNLEHGKHLEAYCKQCGKYTDQVSVSYCDLPDLRSSELTKILGRFVDIVPGVGLFVGKPTVCRCRTLNR